VADVVQTKTIRKLSLGETPRTLVISSICFKLVANHCNVGEIECHATTRAAACRRACRRAAQSRLSPSKSPAKHAYSSPPSLPPHNGYVNSSN